MALTVTHPFVCAIADDPVADAAGEVVPSDWNAAHVGAAAVYNVMDYGALCDGTTDDSTAVQAAINACQAADGGVVYFPGMTRVDSQLTVPNDSDAPVPHQKPMTFRGIGAHWAGIASPVNGGSGLDLRYAGTVGKIVTLGLGMLCIEDMTFINGHNDSLPFIHTTNTTLIVRNNGFIGNSSPATLSDAIVLGGQGASADGTTDGYFQGYGTVIECNYFNYIHRGVLLQKNANAVVIKNNSWWTDCGGTAAIEDWNSSSNGIQGTVTIGNLIEMDNYTYGIKFNYAGASICLGDGFYDDASCTAYYYFGNSAAIPRTVIPGFYATAAKLAAGSYTPNFLITSAANETSLVDSTGSYTNSEFRVGRLEINGNRLVLRATNTDEVGHIYASSHTMLMVPQQSDGFFSIREYTNNDVLKFSANDGTWILRNTKASTGYTYWETQGGAGQSTIPLGRYKNSGGTIATTINADGSFTFHNETKLNYNETNGQSFSVKTLTELLTIAAAATSTTTIQKPANSIILAVSVRVTTAVTCTSTFTVGDAGSATRFSTAAVSKAVNTTDKGTAAGAYYNATAEGIVITPDTVPSDATGRVRVVIHYLEVTPPTS